MQRVARMGQAARIGDGVKYSELVPIHLIILFPVGCVFWTMINRDPVQIKQLRENKFLLVGHIV